jgi:hypothetical protein
MLSESVVGESIIDVVLGVCICSCWAPVQSERAVVSNGTPSAQEQRYDLWRGRVRLGMYSREVPILPRRQDSGCGRFKRPAHAGSLEFMLHFALQSRSGHPLQDDVAKAPSRRRYDFRAAAFTPGEVQAVPPGRVGSEVPVCSDRAFGD